jgi:hypothetical protein
MIRRIPLFFILFPVVLLSGGWAIASHIARQEIYKALQADDIGSIDKELLKLSREPVKEASAYSGALNMKKAGLLSGLKDKLNTFKQGRTQLENAINKEPQNAEYAFLRLIIQENAPAVLGYNTNIKADALLVKQQYKLFDPALQQIVKDYCIKKSKALNASELK